MVDKQQNSGGNYAYPPASLPDKIHSRCIQTLVSTEEQSYSVREDKWAC